MISLEIECQNSIIHIVYSNFIGTLGILGFNLADSMALLICERLHDPVSKRSNYINQGDYLGLDQIELHQIYRTLDQLNESQESFKHMIYQKGRNLVQPTSRCGIFDMSGNLHEYCIDWFDMDYYSLSPPKNPQGPASSALGNVRIIRGGSWFRDVPECCRVASRGPCSPDHRSCVFGFRIAQDF